MTTAQPTSSITEAVVSESDLSANRDEQQENQFMDVDDSLEPMVLLAPDGGNSRFTIIKSKFTRKRPLYDICASVRRESYEKR